MTPSKKVTRSNMTNFKLYKITEIAISKAKETFSRKPKISSSKHLKIWMMFSWDLTRNPLHHNQLFVSSVHIKYLLSFAGIFWQVSSLKQILLNIYGCRLCIFQTSWICRWMHKSTQYIVVTSKITWKWEEYWTASQCCIQAATR